MEKYWPGEILEPEKYIKHGFVFSLRAQIAYELIKHYGSVAATKDKEDSSGRSSLKLQTPQQLVNRCFKIADLFIKKAEEEEDVKRPSICTKEYNLYLKVLREKKDEIIKEMAKDTEREENGL